MPKSRRLLPGSSLAHATRPIPAATALIFTLAGPAAIGQSIGGMRARAAWNSHTAYVAGNATSYAGDNRPPRPSGTTTRDLAK